MENQFNSAFENVLIDRKDSLADLFAQAEKENEIISLIIEKYDQFKSKEDDLIKYLNKIGLIIDKIFIKHSDVKSINTNVNNFNLTVDITAVSNEKFKFIKFAGYTSSGRGKNQELLSNKARTIESGIFDSIGFKARINEFSLESDNKTRDRVMIDIFIK